MSPLSWKVMTWSPALFAAVTFVIHHFVQRRCA
jgi:hypothetical protein